MPSEDFNVLLGAYFTGVAVFFIAMLPCSPAISATPITWGQGATRGAIALFVIQMADTVITIWPWLWDDHASAINDGSPVAIEQSTSTFSLDSDYFVLFLWLALVGAPVLASTLLQWIRRYSSQPRQAGHTLPPVSDAPTAPTMPTVLTPILPPAPLLPPGRLLRLSPLPHPLAPSAGFNPPAGWIFPRRPRRTEHLPRITEAVWFMSRYLPIAIENEPAANSGQDLSALADELGLLSGASDRRPAPETVAEVSSSALAVTCGQESSNSADDPYADELSTPGAGPSSWPGAASSPPSSAPLPSSSAQEPPAHPGHTNQAGSLDNGMLRRGRRRGLPAVVRRGRGRGGSSQQHFDSPDNWRKRN